MNIVIYGVGKIKENYLKDGIAEYSKRLGRYCNLQVVEVPDERAPESLSIKEEEMVKRREGEHILSRLECGKHIEGAKHLQDGSYKIALCVDGASLSSEGLAQKIQSLETSGKSSISFIIGGSLGLSPDVIERCDMKLSFSKMTFPHQLMRLILLEQVYRSFKIIYNETYHK